MVLAATPPEIDLLTVEGIIEQSRKMLEEIDAMETHADPMARAAIERDRALLADLQDGAKNLLRTVMFTNQTHPLAEQRFAGYMPRAMVKGLVTSAEDVQRTLTEARDVIAAVRGQSGDPRIIQWVNVLLDGMVKLFEFYEMRRWQALEAEADCDIAESKVMKFASPQNAAAYLRRIAR